MSKIMNLSFTNNNNNNNNNKNNNFLRIRLCLTPPHDPTQYFCLMDLLRFLDIILCCSDRLTALLWTSVQADNIRRKDALLPGFKIPRLDLTIRPLVLRTPGNNKNRGISSKHCPDKKYCPTQNYPAIMNLIYFGEIFDYSRVKFW